jgi:hypothetical protein
VADSIISHLENEEDVTVGNDLTVAGTLTANTLTATNWGLTTEDIPDTFKIQYVNSGTQYFTGRKYMNGSLEFLNPDVHGLMFGGTAEDNLIWRRHNDTWQMYNSPGYDIAITHGLRVGVQVNEGPKLLVGPPISANNNVAPPNGDLMITRSGSTGPRISLVSDNSDTVGAGAALGGIDIYAKDDGYYRRAASLSWRARNSFSNAGPEENKADGQLSITCEDGSESAAPPQVVIDAYDVHITPHTTVEKTLTVGTVTTAMTGDLMVSSATGAPELALHRSVGNDMSNGDLLGQISWNGHDNNMTRRGACIEVNAFGAWSNVAPKDFKAACRMHFFIQDAEEADNAVASMDLTSSHANLRVDVDVTKNLDVTNHNGSTAGLHLGGVLVTKTAAEINAMSGGNTFVTHTAGILQLTTADHAVVTHSDSGTVTVKLPSTADVTGGESFRVSNEGNVAANVTVFDNPGGERFRLADGSDVPTLVLSKGSSVTVSYGGALHWMIQSHYTAQPVGESVANLTTTGDLSVEGAMRRRVTIRDAGTWFMDKTEYLTVADSNIGGVTVALPDRTTLVGGEVFIITSKNTSPASVVVLDSAETIHTSSANEIQAIAISKGQTVELIYGGGLDWHIISHYRV